MFKMHIHQLKKYAEEIGILELTLKDLIESHKHLKSELASYRAMNKESWQKAYDDALRYCKENPEDYISVNDLKTFSIIELAERLRDGFTMKVKK